MSIYIRLQAVFWWTLLIAREITGKGYHSDRQGVFQVLVQYGGLMQHQDCEWISNAEAVGYTTSAHIPQGAAV